MVTPDLDDRELDRIYDRVEATVDVSKIHSEDDLEKAVLEAKAKKNAGGGWADAINTGVYDRIVKDREEIKVSVLSRVKESMERIDLGKAAKKVFQAVFNKRSKSSYFVARDEKGRFTKYAKKELDEVIYNGRM